VLSSLSDVEWQAAIESIQDPLYNILVNGPRVGILPLITADKLEDVPAELADVIDTRLVMRSAGLELGEEITHLHTTALRFVDAFILSQRDPDAITAVELCVVNDQDIQNLVSYWRQLANQRSQEARPRERTGLTDLLPDLEGSGLGQPQTDRPGTGSLMPTRTRAGALARATQALTTEADERLVVQAMTLAAYLGWIGVGPLRDIFGVSANEARSTIASLQRMGVVEEGSATILRFIRLADNPLDNDSSA
jgi:hypothetical protein